MWLYKETQYIQIDLPVARQYVSFLVVAFAVSKKGLYLNVSNTQDWRCLQSLNKYKNNSIYELKLSEEDILIV